MLSRSSSRAQRGPNRDHHHHYNNFPPQEYTDLSKTDIELLASILTPLPTPGTSAAATYGPMTKQAISELPSHLRAKMPKLSTFCSLHHKLSPLPVIDLLSVVKREVSPESFETWNGTDLPLTLLQDTNAIWTKPEIFFQMFGRSTSTASGWVFQDHKCAACKLAYLSRHPDAVLALGSMAIARLDPKNWKKSKRILWFEEWVKVCMQWEGEGGDAVVQRMWEGGVKLIKFLKENREKRGGKRNWIDGYVKRVTGAQDGHGLGPAVHAAVRPPRSPGQEGHVKFVTEALQEVEENNPSKDPAPSPTTTLTATPGQPNPFDDSYNEGVLDLLFDCNDRRHTYEHGSAVPEPLHTGSPRAASSIHSQRRDERVHLVRTPATTDASSIYSRRPDDDDDGDEGFWRSSRHAPSEHEVIDAYRGSGGVDGSRVWGHDFL